MWKTILSWKKEVKERRNQKAYEDGWCWAMKRFYLEKQCIENIQSFVDCSNHFNDWGEFDSGIEDALDLIKQLEVLRSNK